MLQSIHKVILIKKAGNPDRHGDSWFSNYLGLFAQQA
jgi:hypothetical protein